MELAFPLYFLLVFVFGGLLLLGLTVYFVREFLVRADRPMWSGRTTKSKTVFLASIFLAAGLLFIFLRMVWVTRIGAVPGKYAVEGVWGSATLELRSDGSFLETWHFKSEYSGKPEGDGSLQGRWHDKGRDWFTRDIVLEPFKPLAEYERNTPPGSLTAIVMGYSEDTSIEVDAGADIVFFK